MKLNYILEGITLKHKSEAFQILYNAAADFMYKNLGLSTSIKFVFKKASNSNKIGYFDFKNTIIVKDSSPFLVISYMAHELTHVKQMETRDLEISSNELIWKGKAVVLFSDYIKNKDYEVHKNWPWEMEAYNNQKTLPKIFYQSTEFNKAMNSNKTLKYMLDNQLFP